MTLAVAASPCPNDTFLLYAWIHGLVGQQLPINPHFADIQTLNEWAIEARYPICKVSCAVLSAIQKHYELLPSGTALGRGCGPLLVAKKPFPLAELSAKHIAIPGEKTTAHKLLQLLAPQPAKKSFCRYEEVLGLITDGHVDCGLIIHETRFTFHQSSCFMIEDLGQLWEERYRCPIPLGCFVAHKDLGKECILTAAQCLRHSLEWAWDNPGAPLPFVLAHSREKCPSIVQQHIDLYVTEETAQLSLDGARALSILGKRQSLTGTSDMPKRCQDSSL